MALGIDNVRGMTDNRGRMCGSIYGTGEPAQLLRTIINKRLIN